MSNEGGKSTGGGRKEGGRRDTQGGGSQVKLDFFATLRNTLQ